MTEHFNILFYCFALYLQFQNDCFSYSLFCYLFYCLYFLTLPQCISGWIWCYDITVFKKTLDVTGCGSGQPGLEVGEPAHSRGVETRWPLWFLSTQAILWSHPASCDSELNRKNRQLRSDDPGRSDNPGEFCQTVTLSHLWPKCKCYE